MNDARMMSLFDVEDETDVPKVRDMTVGPASPREVDEFCRRYHYTASGGSLSWRYGLWYGATLWGVIAYNLPTREACGVVFGPEHGYDHVWHMGRLVLPDHAPRNSESRLIGGSLRLIEINRPDVWAVLTYAAIDAGHIGYVYQATNALYTGTGGDSNYYTAPDGRRMGTKQGGTRRGGFKGGHVSPALAAEWGWTHHRGDAKHRYVYILGDRRQRRARRALLQLPVLPYPKAGSQ